MGKKTYAFLGCLGGAFLVILLGLGFLFFADDLVDDLFSGDGVVIKQSGGTTTITRNIPNSNNNTNSVTANDLLQKLKVNRDRNVSVKRNLASSVQLQNFSNGMFSMQIPSGWKVGVGNSDLTHYTFMVFNPSNPDYKIFFNMKTEGYLKTQQMRDFYRRTYPTAQMAQLPAINPQTTDNFYKNFTQSFLLSQSILPFKVPVLNNFKTVQSLGRNATGGEIVRGSYQNENGKMVEGIFTATIKEFAMPPVVMLLVYNTVYFTAPEGELIDWIPVLNRCLGSVRFSQSFIDGYYREQGTVVKNANALQAICNQTSEIITSGWNARQKTYDILSQKRSDATMGYERVRDTETNEIYKATNGFMDHDWHGRYEAITDDMYTLPTAGYIEKP